MCGCENYLTVNLVELAAMAIVLTLVLSLSKTSRRVFREALSRVRNRRRSRGSTSRPPASLPEGYPPLFR